MKIIPVSEGENIICNGFPQFLNLRGRYIFKGGVLELHRRILFKSIVCIRIEICEVNFCPNMIHFLAFLSSLLPAESERIFHRRNYHV